MLTENKYIELYILAVVKARLLPNRSPAACGASVTSVGNQISALGPRVGA